MTNLVSLEGEREKRKEPCIYCGGEAHRAQLACPRILCVEIADEGYICGIVFRRHWQERVAGEEPT